MTKKVFISGCFDMLHSGHVAFFQEAAQYGDLYVAIGSDKTVFDLKGRTPVTNEQERLYMIQAVSSVTEAFVSTGSGMLDFENELRTIKPDYFVVNEDGNIPQKKDLCTELNIEYVVLQRTPHGELPARSTTALRGISQMPYRIDLAGGWLDQPFVSELYPGPVITISIEPTIEFNERSGMASSTRRAAIEMWGVQMPVSDYEKLAKMLFCFDNPPGTKEISGSQDAIGLAIPGLCKSNYEGEYWPASIDRIGDELALQFVEQALYLVPLGPRHDGYAVLSDTYLSKEGAKALADATDACWQAIVDRDVEAFGQAVRASFDAQIAMFPFMTNESINNLIDQYKDIALGWKLSGAGGGGYLILVSETPIPDAVRVVARRANE
ncbi:MAG: adenylyltransferase/cytidyltransferase family protein [Chloroflexota bacterium]